jgi:hypothetical protein
MVDGWIVRWLDRKLEIGDTQRLLEMHWRYIEEAGDWR